MAAESSENIARRLNALEDEPLFHTLIQLQDERVIADLFSNHQKLPSQDNPILIIMVGSPGTGKTTMANKIIQEQELHDSDFYKVSLDRLTESVKPYRNLTRNAYTHLTRNKKELNNSNLAKISGIYTSFIHAKKENFKANKTRRRIFEGVTNKAKNEDPAILSLNELLWKGLRHGIQHRFNILYDTTIGKTGDKIKTEITDVLAEFPDIKYKLLVVLVEAPEEQIKQQLEKRHQNFIKKGYIRAIPLRPIKGMIEDNQKGYNTAKEYFNSEEFEEKYPNLLAEPAEFIRRKNIFSKALFTGIKSNENNSKSSNNTKGSKKSKRR